MKVDEKHNYDIIKLRMNNIKIMYLEITAICAINNCTTHCQPQSFSNNLKGRRDIYATVLAQKCIYF